jgi:hypothetical protein
MQQRHKEAMLKRTITSGKLENTQQDFQADRRAGDHKANTRDFHYTAENECQGTVEGSATSETEEETINNSLWAEILERQSLSEVLLAPTGKEGTAVSL